MWISSKKVNFTRLTRQCNAIFSCLNSYCTVYCCITLSNSQHKLHLCSVLLANIVAELWLVLTDLWEFNSFSKLALMFPNCPTRNSLSSSAASPPTAHQALGQMAANANLLQRCHLDASVNTKSIKLQLYYFIQPAGNIVSWTHCLVWTFEYLGIWVRVPSYNQIPVQSSSLVDFQHQNLTSPHLPLAANGRQRPRPHHSHSVSQ